MIAAYSGTQVRDTEAGYIAAPGQARPGRNDPGLDLMQRAAAGLAATIVILLRQARIRRYGSRVLVLAGGGNNGGDALFAAAHLARRGMGTTAVLTSAHTHRAALAAFIGAGGRTVELTDANASGMIEHIAAEFSRASVAIDGLLGTGGHGGLREPAAGLVHRLAAATPRPLIVACDLPSGVAADTGEVEGPVLGADATVSFGAAKSGLLAGPGQAYAGRMHIIPIGIEDRLPSAQLLRLEAADMSRLWPLPLPSSHKYSRGVLGIVAGSAQFPGAGVLCAQAAVAAGTGMVRYLGPGAVAALIQQRTPEVVCSQAGADRIRAGEVRVQAWLVGPGTDEDPGQLDRAAAAAATGLPVAADAAALSRLPAQPGPQVILTPHAGELARLLTGAGTEVSRAAIEAAPLRYAREAAQRIGATVLLKGAATLVASPTGMVFSQAEGTSWLATAGSGDTLAGILGALLSTMDPSSAAFAATGIEPEDRWAAIAAMAAGVHGMAATRASRGTGDLRRGTGTPISATDISTALGATLFDLLEQGRPDAGPHTAGPDTAIVHTDLPNTGKGI